MLIEDKKFKSTEEDIQSYFNLKESQKFIISTTSTEPSEDHLLYKSSTLNGHGSTGVQGVIGGGSSSLNGFNNSQNIPKNRNTPKSMVGIMDNKKHTINSSILAAHQYQNKPSHVSESISSMIHKSH